MAVYSQVLQSLTVKVAVVKEIAPGESRVALVPDTVTKLTAAGMTVQVETGAGERAFFTDPAYQEAGAGIAPDAATLCGNAEVVVKVQRPQAATNSRHEVDLLAPGTVLLSFLQPLADPQLVQRLAARRVTSFSLDLLPRISRAQSMDALSSQSTVAGYKAALLAANALGRFFPMLMTAAGTVVPAKVLVLGAGVAGLQAIATARRLGAVVQAYDVRPAVKEEVQSLGATFVELPLEVRDAQDAGGYAKQQSEEVVARQRELLGQHVREADVVIATAVIPGKRAPVLVTEVMVDGMRPGSIIVDLAAETGGNCALTRAGEVVARHGVLIHGVVNIASSMPIHASQLFSKNVASFLALLVRDGKVNLNFDDEILGSACVTHAGEIRHAPTREAVGAAP
jgi:NAD(P) transhydrogenase subunit alpha